MTEKWSQDDSWQQGRKTSVQRIQVAYSRKRLYLAAFVGNLLYVSVGCVMGWSSPTVPALKLRGLVTAEEGSWLGSLYCVGAALGASLSGLCMNTLGRKPTLLITMGLFLLSWLLLAVTRDIIVMYTGRIIGGLGVGASFASVPVYLAEISDNEVRGAIGSLNQMFVGVGLLLQYSAGPYTSYLGLILVSISVAVVFGLCFVLMPESPYYLEYKGRRGDALASLCWLRGGAKPPQVNREIENIQETLKKKAGHKSDLFLKRGPLKAFLISLWAMSCQQVSGVNVVLSFSQSIFEMATKSISPEMSSVMIGLTNIITSCFAPPLVKRFGLKYILIFFGFGMSICQIILAIYFHLSSAGYDMSNFTWLPVTSLIIFCTCFCIGPGPLPWTSVAEMFPPHLKGVASALIGAYVWILSFALMKTYNRFLQAYGDFSVFLFFGLAELVGVTLLAVVLPNTKGLSFQEIQDLLQNNNSEESDSGDEFKH